MFASGGGGNVLGGRAKGWSTPKGARKAQALKRSRKNPYEYKTFETPKNVTVAALSLNPSPPLKKKTLNAT